MASGSDIMKSGMSGYVGFANLPNQVHRKSVKKGFEFTIMVVGESGLGKSTLVNSLFLTDLYPERQVPTACDSVRKTVKIEASTVEIEEKGVKLRLTVVDTPGYGDSIDSTDCFKPIVKYIDEQFEKYFRDESGLNRRNIVDNRIHCCFYFVNPAGHGLKPLDIEFMKVLHHKVNLVPVIAKSDTLTHTEVLRMKQRIMSEIAQNRIRLYQLPDCDTDEDDAFRDQVKNLKLAMPFAVCGSSQQIEVQGRKVRGRQYPWGVIDIENPDHCDFIKLRTMLIIHMQDLEDMTHDCHYENYRSSRLSQQRQQETAGTELAQSGSSSTADQLSEKDRMLQEKENELKRMQDMLSKMQAQIAQSSTSSLQSVNSEQ